VGSGGKRTASTALAHGTTRERGRESARWQDRMTGRVRLSARAGAGARASWADLG
jgi:hypothetical protein